MLPPCGPHGQSCWLTMPEDASVSGPACAEQALLGVRHAGFADKLVVCAAKGRADAKAWAKASGALSVVQPGAEKEVPASADQQDEDYGDLEKAHPDTNAAGNLPQAAAVQGKAASTKAK